MIELPEALTLSRQLNESVAGKAVTDALPPTKPHKFCWFNGLPEEYGKQIAGSKIVSAQGFGIYVELVFDNNKRLCINDGVNPRLLNASDTPKDYQLLITLEDGTKLCFTVAM